MLSDSNGKILKKIERTINIAVVILRQLHLESKLQQVTMNHQLFCKAGRRWVAYQIVKCKRYQDIEWYSKHRETSRDNL